MRNLLERKHDVSRCRATLRKNRSEVAGSPKSGWKSRYSGSKGNKNGFWFFHTFFQISWQLFPALFQILWRLFVAPFYNSRPEKFKAVQAKNLMTWGFCYSFLYLSEAFFLKNQKNWSRESKVTIFTYYLTRISAQIACLSMKILVFFEWYGVNT